jgi:uncharacterized damage-inducible protein DinB
VSQTGRDLAALLARELDGFKRELAMFPDDESAWRTVPGITNSAANLALHVAGNLHYFIGVVLGGGRYARDRAAEFGRRSGPREDVYREIDAAIRAVLDVLPALPEDRLDGEFPETVMGMTFRTRLFLLHLCAHGGFHLGQAGYLRRVVTGDATSSGPIPLAPIAIDKP